MSLAMVCVGSTTGGKESKFFFLLDLQMAGFDLCRDYTVDLMLISLTNMKRNPLGFIWEALHQDEKHDEIIPATLTC